MSTVLTRTKKIKTVREYSNDTIFHGSVYGLELVDDKKYVGYTMYPKTRFKQHWNGEGAKWTMKYEPTDIINYIPGDVIVEELITLIYMRDFGIGNVRGSKWCHTECSIPKPFVYHIKKKINKIGDITTTDVMKDYSLCNLIT